MRVISGEWDAALGVCDGAALRLLGITSQSVAEFPAIESHRKSGKGLVQRVCELHGEFVSPYVIRGDGNCKNKATVKQRKKQIPKQETPRTRADVNDSGDPDCGADKKHQKNQRPSCGSIKGCRHLSKSDAQSRLTSRYVSRNSHRLEARGARLRLFGEGAGVGDGWFPFISREGSRRYVPIGRTHPSRSRGSRGCSRRRSSGGREGASAGC